LTGTLLLHIAGVGTDDLARGVGAAHAVLRAHGVSPAEADHGRWRRDLCEALGLAGDPTILSRRDAAAALAWDEAFRAAVAVACPESGPLAWLDARLGLPALPSIPPAVEQDRLDVEPLVENRG
jgi:hypothetical protein